MIAEILQRGHDQRSGRRSMIGDPAAGPMIADIVRMDPADNSVMIGDPVRRSARHGIRSDDHVGRSGRSAAGADRFQVSRDPVRIVHSAQYFIDNFHIFVNI